MNVFDIYFCYLIWLAFDEIVVRYFRSRTGKELSAVHTNAPLKLVSFAIIIDSHSSLLFPQSHLCDLLSHQLSIYFLSHCACTLYTRFFSLTRLSFENDVMVELKRSNIDSGYFHKRESSTG